MHSRLIEGKIIRVANRILGLAGLAGLALVCAGAACAQSKPAQTESTAARPTAAAPAIPPGTQSSSTAQAATQTLAQNSPAKSPAPKGQHEGITVHGHWIIEVKNPNGSVAERLEFENSLCTSQALAAGGGSAFLVGGDQLIAQSLAGTGGPYFQMWTVQLSSSPATGTSPCVQATQAIAPFLLTSGSDPLAASGSVPCNVDPTTISVGTATPTVVCTGLVVSAQSSPPTLTLSGTVVALTGSAISYPFTIGAVSTNLALGTNKLILNTEDVYLGCTATYCGTFTATSLPSPGVTVQQGQSILVTVSFTFSSPS